MSTVKNSQHSKISFSNTYPINKTSFIHCFPNTRFHQLPINNSFSSENLWHHRYSEICHGLDSTQRYIWQQVACDLETVRFKYRLIQVYLLILFLKYWLYGQKTVLEISVLKVFQGGLSPPLAPPLGGRCCSCCGGGRCCCWY